AGGTAAMYDAMLSMGYAANSDFSDPITLQGDAKGASVIILGAGIAGMVAAYEMRKAGYKVKILEFNNRPGGRNWSLHAGDSYTDIGGTTTDVGVVEHGAVAVAERGAIEGVHISYPMSDVTSSGVGGSSVIQVANGEITVGPQSVGAAPGPACFGFGGKQATITDVNLLLGILDPDTYLDGTFTLDSSRSRAVISETIAQPLGMSLEEALIQMERAYFQALSESFAALVTEDTTLLAFGGAGPMSATGAARLAGVKQVLVPRTAAVFSAFGISFSDIGKTYEVAVGEPTTKAAVETHNTLLARAERDMFQEGYALADCETSWQLLVENLDDGSVSR
ncbi:MAG: NAD(P)-binding protein, partial [Actinobacteria bacterium]|nr:NAD(P)-binding protein [Actinomycetota bacterium]